MRIRLSGLFPLGLLCLLLLASCGRNAALDTKDVAARAEATVKKLGGKALRDDKASDQPLTIVILADTQATDADLKDLHGLTKLKQLSCHRPAVCQKRLFWSP